MATYLSIKNVASDLWVSRRTIHRYIKNGQLRVIRITPRTIRVSRQAWKEFLAAENGNLKMKTKLE